MHRAAALLLLVSAAAAAPDDFDRKLAQAERTMWEMPEWATWEERLNAQYEALSRLGVEHHGQWEVHFLIGLNRCKRAFFARGETDNHLARIRARGATDDMLASTRQGAELQIGRWLEEARQNFLKMRYFMEKAGERDLDRVLFGEAALRFAGRQYLRKGREPGAIEYYQELVRRNFMPEVCADHIALCFMDLGYEKFLADEFAEAHGYWDEGLRFAQQQTLKQMLLTNKAGAYEMDNEYGLAEKVLREQIEKEAHRPTHHKNLGLVLGFQGRLKEALAAYGRARELCLRSPAARQLSLLHGNAWIRSATIHGTLLEQDGDMRLAWRLFLEYRELFGDDYNFSLWFGDFAASHRQFDLAWTLLTRARDLQPHCTVPYQKLTLIALRTSGSQEEVRQRVEVAKEAYAEAQRRYIVREESPAVKRLCGGFGDLGDLGVGSVRAERLDPDPLAGSDPERPPAWVVEAAGRRSPFKPHVPEPAPASAAEEAAPPESGETPAWVRIAAIAGGGLVLLAAGFLLFRRRA